MTTICSLERMLIIIQQLVIIIMIFISAAAAAVAGQLDVVDPADECQRRCGDVEIPYPFGTTESCALGTKFHISCTTGDKPKMGDDLVVTNISIENHEISIESKISKVCYKDGLQILYHDSHMVPLFTISSSRNKFIVIGCDSYAYLYGNYTEGVFNYSTGCFSKCTDFDTVSASGSCSGIGCCQVDIPPRLQNAFVLASSFDNHTEIGLFNPCTYAFVVEQNQFRFSQDYLQNFPQERVPLVLDWAIDHDTCDRKPGDQNHNQKVPFCPCGENTDTHSMNDGSKSYYCLCKAGFSGNPYSSHGCQDINECQDSNPCSVLEDCDNQPGTYTCRPKDQLLVIKVTVAMELEGLRKTQKYPWVSAEVNMEETEYLLAESSNANDGSITASAYDSIRNHVEPDFSGR
ncbi:hypothetical protein FEM48_Zijuj01G0325700 [Ziziphus jujuba var. spinosa]|uniref:Wall-associated receptor kinase galacturonan-binding domain-containing protein n=1 Tax=Ziziphus jujuba var. spinosa TaxID=714518 RepID=A0A978W6K4_ZIZJJ|nr:hypothetical protein FEM48_Zijuj01G0325700 [Ziziphus jujuba var. spinosa]